MWEMTNTQLLIFCSYWAIPPGRKKIKNISCKLVSANWKYCAYFSLPPTTIYSPAETSPRAGRYCSPCLPRDTHHCRKYWLSVKIRWICERLYFTSNCRPIFRYCQLVYADLEEGTQLQRVNSWLQNENILKIRLLEKSQWYMLFILTAVFRFQVLLLLF